MKTTDLTLRAAGGEDLGVIGTVVIRGYIGKHRVIFEAALSTKVKKCLLSGIKLRQNGYVLTVSKDCSYIMNEGH